MIKVEDLTGQKFNFLTVVKRGEDWYGPSGRRTIRWECRCICGNLTSVRRYDLLKGNTQSCGCYNKKRVTETHTTHGQSTSREYRIWIGIKYRCLNPDIKGNKRYAGRGIQICKRWLESFDNFYDDMGPAPDDSYSIDRKDVDGLPIRNNSGIQVTIISSHTMERQCV